MKFFTLELMERLASLDDAVADAADAEWEDAVTRHEEQLQAIRPHLPPSLCYLWDNFYLHDADVLSLGRQGQTFVIVLRLEVPPRELLILNYQLAEEPLINPEALPLEGRGSPVQWMYDELGLLPDQTEVSTHTILFSNGWEVQLRLRDVQVIAAQTLLAGSAPQVELGVAQSTE